ncbi:hypothetical protein [Nitritalea halalkaliphila]|uniref:hypothetical protein n=1 Tax=Nitritalea halalkaliphila TaxID=590849 RepID=UPI000306BEC9
MCFRFWKNGKQVDWLKEKIPPSTPILPENRAAFEAMKNEVFEKMAAIQLGPDSSAGETTLASRE